LPFCGKLRTSADSGREHLFSETRWRQLSSLSHTAQRSSGLKDFLYINPNTFETDEEKNIIIFQQGSYATMKPGAFNGRVKVDSDGFYVFKSWDEEEDPKRPDGHFGIWNMPDNFQLYVYAWVLPDYFEVIDQECNRDGQWVLRNNTLAWYGENVNDIVFTIRYRARSSKTLEAIRTTLEEDPNENIEVSAEESGVKVTISGEMLFPSGSSELSAEGKSELARLAPSLATNSQQRIVVEGHTDNVEISGELAKKFESNWELSAARALAVVRFLQISGVPGERLESRAFGEFRPKNGNDTEEGRSQNRRIEVLILEDS
jgi:flagellar motor protein MotB